VTIDYPSSDAKRRHQWLRLAWAPPLLAAAYLPPALLLNWLTQKACLLCGMQCASQETIRNLHSMDVSQLAMALSTALLLSPVAEEMLFRWLMPKALARLHLTKHYPEAIAAVAFAAIHPLPWAWPMLFAFALVQSHCLRKQGLLFAILVHAFFNAWQLLLAM